MKTVCFAAIVALALLPAASLHAQSASARPLITGVSHLSVYTTDAAKAEVFYTHDLGAAKRHDPQNPAGVRYYFSAVQFIEVLPLPTGDTSSSRMDHVAFNTSNAESLRQYLAAHGVSVPAKVESGNDGSDWFNVEDPEGNKIQFVQPPAKPAPVTPGTLSHHIIHVGFIVHNLQRRIPSSMRCWAFVPTGTAAAMTPPVIGSRSRFRTARTGSNIWW